MVNQKLEAALSLAERGLSILPLRPMSKEPASPNGVGDATRDPAVIRAWFEASPDMNYGVCPGEYFVILDIDAKGKNGVENFISLEIENDPTISDSTFRVETPSAGFHLYLKAPFAAANAHNFPAGIDIRGSRGYVVGPCCELPNGAYTVTKDAEIAAAPAWVITRLKKQGERAEHAGESVVELDQPANVQRACDFLQRCAPAIEGEGGDAWTKETADCVGDLGVSESVCLELMREHFNPRCVPEWNDDELAKKVENSYAYRERPLGVKASNPAAMDEAMERIFAAAPAEPSQPKDNLLPLYREDELDAIPQPEWLIEDLVSKNALAIAFGDTGNLKSFVMVRAAVCGAAGIAFGSSVNSPEIQKHKIPRKLRTVIVAGEGQSGLAKRIKACKRHLRITGNLPIAIVPQLEALTDPAKLRKLIDTIREKFGPVDIIWVDTMARAGVGLDLNNPSQAVELESAFRIIMRELSCAVFAIGHTGKDESKGLAGARQQVGQADHLFHVKFYKGQGAGYGTLHLTNEKEREEATGGVTYFKVSVFVLDPGAMADAEAGQPVRKPVTSLVLDAIEGSTLPQPADADASEAGYIDTAVAIIRERSRSAAEPCGPLASRVAERLSPNWDTMSDGEKTRLEGIIGQRLRKAAGSDPRLAPYAFKDGTAKTASWLFGVRPSVKRTLH